MSAFEWFSDSQKRICQPGCYRFLHSMRVPSACTAYTFAPSSAVARSTSERSRFAKEKLNANKNNLTAMDAAGIPTEEFAGLCYDTEENGDLTNWSLRYAELLTLCVREIQSLKAELWALKTS